LIFGTGKGLQEPRMDFAQCAAAARPRRLALRWGPGGRPSVAPAGAGSGGRPAASRPAEGVSVGSSPAS
jgi:hypothetical protein